jgi:hypothetical protein
MLGTLNSHRSVPRPAPPMSSSPSEMLRVDVLGVAYVEEMAPGVLVREKMVEVPALMAAVGANVSPCVDGNHANGAEPRPEYTPSWAALTPGTSKGPDSIPSWEAALDVVTSVLGSFDIVDLGTRVAGIPPSAISAHQMGVSGRVARVQS